MAEVAGTTMTIPRRCGRQSKRNNIPGETPEVYYRRVLFIPFLDDLLEQLESRFSAMSAKSLIGLKLLPGKNLSEDDVAHFEEVFGDDLPSLSTCRGSDVEQKVGMCGVPACRSAGHACSNPPAYVPKHPQDHVLTGDHFSDQCWCRTCKLGTQTHQNSDEIHNAARQAECSPTDVCS